MFDLCDENGKSSEQKIINKSTIPDNIPINNFVLQKSGLKDDSKNSELQPVSNPSISLFLQNFTFKSFPSIDNVIKKEAQIRSKTLRFVKVSNDLINKINLLEEIYDGPEYKKLKKSNKCVQCSLDRNLPYKQLTGLISKVDNNNTSLCDRTIHPAYSNDDLQEDLVMDSSGLFKVPSTPTLIQDSSNDNCNEFIQSLSFVDEGQQDEQVEQASIFLEHDGNTYIRVDDLNYHLIQSYSEDGLVITETGLHIMIPEGTGIPMNNVIVQELPQHYTQYPQRNNYIQEQSFLLNTDSFLNKDNKVANRKMQKNDNGPYFGHLPHVPHPSPNTMKLYSDYVALPLRPAPLTPFTLSSQLYTPELSISLTEQESELMLTIDSTKRTQPQQQPIYYQIYSYKDEDRYAKPTSEVWGLVGEIKSCPLPMFCTISIPSGFHKHYFAIRSVDEFSRFSDWSNVVQVEVENNQMSPSSIDTIDNPLHHHH